MQQRLDLAARGLPPAYFALVMATGIVALACRLKEWPMAALILAGLAVCSYLVLWALTLWRLLRYPQEMFRDFCTHGVAPGFFTTVAASSIVGSLCVGVVGRPDLGAGFWLLAVLLALGLTYSIFAALTISQAKPTLEKGLNGGWLVVVVAWQSLCVLGCLLVPSVGGRAGDLLLVCLLSWLVGGMLYMWIISLIFYRYMFHSLPAEELAPPYWINMGAVAISTLGGVGLVANAQGQPLLIDLLPFLKGGTWTFWATASWWIPLLVLLGVWRHGVRRFPLQYSPLYWSAVFPLGMYTVATHRLAEVSQQPLLMSLSNYFIYLAIGAWLAAAWGLLGRLLAGLRS